MRPITSFSEPNVKQLLDLELGAYAVVTYRPSDLHPDLRKGIEVIVAKRTTHPQEVQTLLTMVGEQKRRTRMGNRSRNARHRRGCSLAWE